MFLNEICYPHNFQSLVGTTPYKKIFFGDTFGEKVLLAFSKPFWESDPTHRTGSHVFTDLPVQSIYYPSVKYATGNKAVLLASYTWGGPARRQTSLPDEMLVDECLKVVAKVGQLWPLSFLLSRLSLSLSSFFHLSLSLPTRST